jgi:chemotaxis protein histidine kinase CheA
MLLCLAEPVLAAVETAPSHPGKPRKSRGPGGAAPASTETLKVRLPRLNPARQGRPKKPKQRYGMRNRNLDPLPPLYLRLPRGPRLRRAASRNPAADSTLRVDVELLNRMMNLVGELVLTRNQILQATAPTPT